MAMISQEFKDLVIAKTDMVQLVSGYIRLESRDENTWKGLCPFHRDYSGTFVVSPGKKIFKCFKCGKGGDPVRFVMMIEKKGFLEAVGVLAERAGLSMGTP